MRRLLRITALALVVAAAAWGRDIVVAGAAHAQVVGGGPQGEAAAIAEIVIEGSQRIEPTTIRSYLTVREGAPFDPERLNASVRRLFETGLFSDVELRRRGNDLVVRVVENPIINRIAFEGNRRIDDETLQAEVQLRPRVVFTRARVQSAVQRILELYRRSGRFAATVEPKVIQLEQNRVDLVFEINEGATTSVEGINFVGNSVFPDSELRSVLITKENRWYRFLTQGDIYDPDRLNLDKELLRRFYVNNGYIDFSVTSVVAELTPDREDFFVTFTVEEGERYRIGNVDLNIAIPELEAEELREAILLEPGEWYSARDVDASVRRLLDLVGSRGYAFTDIDPQIRRDTDDNIAHVDFVVREGPRVFVDRIEIVGNVRTLDEVIRREVSLAEGDAFSTTKLRLARQRIFDLGFFTNVGLDVQRVPGAPDRTVVTISVSERSTGELSFGAGFSTQSGAVIEFSLRERNLLGRGQDLKVAANLSLEGDQQYDISFTEPYFLDRRLVAGFDLYNLRRNVTESGFEQDTIGGGLRLGYQLLPHLSQSWKYGIRYNDIVAGDTASTFIKEQAGESLISSVSTTLAYDRRDSTLMPTSGWYTRVTGEVAGLAWGDISQQFLRANGGASKYFPVTDKVVFSLTATAGIVQGYGGKEVPITERYFLGGDTVRGFDTAGISPRAATTRDALGGLWMASGSAQLNFPLGLPEELGITGSAFIDGGTIGASEDTGAGVLHESSLRLSYGFGVTWRSPMGPMTFDFGWPVEIGDVQFYEPFDKLQQFRFNFGTRF